MEHELPCGIVRPELKTRLPSQIFRLLLWEFFRWNDPKSRFPFILQSDFPEKHVANGKQLTYLQESRTSGNEFF